LLDEVKNYLKKFGPLVYCRLAFFKNGTLKGFGFAEFKNAEDA
jgi:RNA recognition motif-containing protein